MNCPEKEILMMWIDGELPATDADKTAHHVEQCSVCRNFISAQRMMEAVWRDAWIDPAEATFEKMRGKLKPETPWWRTQRTWYIAAVLCAAYIGVRMYYADDSRLSLSTIVMEETAITFESAPDAVPVQENQQEALEEYEQEIEEGLVLMDSPSVSYDSSIQQEEMPVEESQTYSEIAVSDDYEVLDITMSLGTLNGCTGELDTRQEPGDQAGILDQISQLQTIPEEIEMQDSDDTEEFYRSVCSSVSVSSGNEADEGTILGGASGGGGVSASPVGCSETVSCYFEAEDSIENELEILPSQESLIDYRISVTLETQEVFQIQREQWTSLFSLIDTLLAENSYSEEEPLVISVSDDGIVSGPEIRSGTVIDIPETRYGACTVTVTFY